MIENDGDDHIDKSCWLGPNEPIITPERAQKGDVFTGPTCDDCHGSGKNDEYNSPCRACHGKGWMGTVNAQILNVSDIHFAQIQIRNILNFLWEKDAITDDHHDHGHLFKAWRDQHRVAMGQERAISGESSESTGIKLRAYGFILLVKRLSIYDYKAIESSIEIFSNQHTQAFALRDRKIYRQAFDRLSQVIIPIREHIAALEALSDEDRAMLSDERLKKFIDGMEKNG